MKQLDKSELRRIIEIKSEFESGKISSNLISPEDQETINIIYEVEINTQKEQLDELKNNIDELYIKMQEIVDKVENNK